MKASPNNLYEVILNEMARKLTPKEIGQLSEEDLRDLAARVYREIELRVGERLSAPLSDAEMQEFEDILNSPEKGEIDSMMWLISHCPNYRDVVIETTGEVVEEAVEAAVAVLHVEVTAAEDR